MGVTETSAAAKAEVSSLVQSYLQQQSILLPTVSDYSFMAQKGVSSIKLPRSGGFTVGDKAENTAADATTVTYAADTITLNKHKYIQFLIEKIADKHTSVAVAQDMLMKASKDLAYQIDLDIVVELKLASAAAPDHQIVFIDTVTDVIAKGDILAARALLQAQNVDVKDCYIGIGPEKENELLALADFIQAERYGSAAPIQLGEFGKIYGMPVLVSNAFSDFMCVWHKSAVGIAFSQGIEVDSDKDLANLGTRYSLDMIYGVEVLDGGKRQVFVDSTNA